MYAEFHEDKSVRVSVITFLAETQNLFSQEAILSYGIHRHTEAFTPVSTGAVQ
jgi:hypothetical protein